MFPEVITVKVHMVSGKEVKVYLDKNSAQETFFAPFQEEGVVEFHTGEKNLIIYKKHVEYVGIVPETQVGRLSESMSRELTTHGFALPEELD